MAEWFRLNRHKPPANWDPTSMWLLFEEIIKNANIYPTGETMAARISQAYPILGNVKPKWCLEMRTAFFGENKYKQANWYQNGVYGNSYSQPEDCDVAKSRHLKGEESKCYADDDEAVISECGKAMTLSDKVWGLKNEYERVMALSDKAWDSEYEKEVTLSGLTIGGDDQGMHDPTKRQRKASLQSDRVVDGGDVAME